jgi:hypothetical protein
MWPALGPRTMNLQSALLLAVAALPGVGGPSFGNVSLSLSTDHPTYWVGEPVRLTLTVSNQGTEAVDGYFQLGLEETEI